MLELLGIYYISNISAAEGGVYLCFHSTPFIHKGWNFSQIIPQKGLYSPLCLWHTFHTPSPCVCQATSKYECSLILRTPSLLLRDVVWHMLLSDIIGHIYSFSNISTMGRGWYPHPDFHGTPIIRHGTCVQRRSTSF